MKKINIYPLFAFLFIVVLLTGCKKQSERTGEGRPTNIIFIMADDLGYGDLGCFGQEVIATPNIDGLALEGTRFTHCYAGAPVCAPSRSVLMTGKHTGHTHVRGNGSDKVDKPYPLNRVPLRPQDTTVAQILKKAGYVTGITGKWGLGEAETSGIPNKKGFDEWRGFLNQKYAHNYYPEYIWRNQEKMHLAGNEEGKEEDYVHDYFIEFALDFIENNQDTCFFLYYSITLPHARYEIPDSELMPFKDQAWTEEEKVQAAMVTRLDREVGQIISLLRTLDIADNTLVFFCSDNGAAERWEGRFDSSGKLRGRKRDVYEGGIRTPMIAWMPGRVPASKVNGYPWYFADVLPTLAELAHVQAPDDIDGMSILPLILGEEPLKADRFMYWEFHEKGFDQGVRWKNWKAVRHGLTGNLELYDLENDEGEEHEISRSHPEVVETMEGYLDTARTESYYWPVQDALNE